MFPINPYARITPACNHCRDAKRKCSRGRICTFCRRRDLRCVYVTQEDMRPGVAYSKRTGGTERRRDRRDQMSPIAPPIDHPRTGGKSPMLCPSPVASATATATATAIATATDTATAPAAADTPLHFPVQLDSDPAPSTHMETSMQWPPADLPFFDSEFDAYGSSLDLGPYLTGPYLTEPYLTEPYLTGMPPMSILYAGADLAVDMYGSIVYYSPKLAALTGYEHADSIGWNTLLGHAVTLPAEVQRLEPFATGRPVVQHELRHGSTGQSLQVTLSYSKSLNGHLEAMLQA